MTSSTLGQPSKARERFVLRGVTVVNTRDGSLTADMDVLVEGNSIGAIKAVDNSAGNESTRVIDGSGKFVVPGFLDLHVHSLEEKDPSGGLALMLANGVTGFRQMSGSDRLLKRRATGTLVLPDASPGLLAMPGSILTPVNAGTEAAAIATVRGQQEAGADFIKVGMVKPASFFAAQVEARRLGIPIVGHLPTGIDVVAASKGGMKSIEHLGPGVGILAATSTDESGVQEMLAKKPEMKLPPFRFPYMDKLMAVMIKKLVVNPLARADPVDVQALGRADSTFSEERVLALAAHFVADGTWQSPTLIRVRTQQFADAPEYSNDPNLRYMSEDTIKQWRKVTSKFLELPAAARAIFRANYALQLRLTKLFDEAGVKMIAGSDVSGAAWEIPGFSLHQEFDQLGAAGLSPLRVLQMATLDGAEFLGTTSTMGTVEAGKNADLVLLDANPLDGVDNLHTVAAVVRAGRYYSRADLDELKNEVAAARSVR